ncbi:MAG TPA: ATP-binding protein [bacterium]
MMVSYGSHRWSISGTSPNGLVLAGVGITLFLFGLVVWEALTAYGSYQSISEDQIALERLDTELTRLDETLSTSALLSVATDNPAWKTRYAAAQLQLDSVLAEAAAVLDTSQSRAELYNIRTAHTRRVNTETLAMGLAFSGDRVSAEDLLSSNLYLELKQAYVQSIGTALQRLNDREENNGDSLRKKLRLIALFTAGVVGVAWLSIVGALQLNFRRRRAAELILRESEARYRGVTEAAFDDILLSEDGILLDCSDKFARMCGYDRAELRGRPTVELVALEDRELVRNAQKSGYEKPYEALCLRKDGTRFPVEICGKTVPFHGRLARVTAVRDISDRKHAEAEREALIRDLKCKNEELERFSYTVSHDLKSPLITIKGFLKWIDRDAAAGNRERLQQNLERIGDAVDKMEHFMNSLLEWSRNGHQPLKHDPVPLEDLAREATGLVNGRIAQRGVAVQIAPGLPVVYGDRSRLLEVILNLLDNAIKFMGNQPRPRVEIGIRHAGTEPVLYVKDNGIGIAPPDQTRILALFEKLDPQAEGSGVGLALVKRIVEQHGGSLWIESDGPGKGSTFCFRLSGVAAGQAA